MRIFAPSWTFVSILFFWLAGCGISLVPAYDGGLVDKLDGLNTDAQTLFAALDQGAPRSQFGRFEGDYNALIGGFEAARLQAEARDAPALGRRLAQSPAFETACQGKRAKDCINTTPGDLAFLIDGLRDMRNTHRTSGMSAGTVDLFKQDYDISISAILRIETALER